MRIAACVGFILLTLLSRTQASSPQTSDQDYRTRTRDLFLAVERTARLQSSQQDLQIARIYSEVWPTLEREMLAALTQSNVRSLTVNGIYGQNLKPEELADALDRQGGWPLVAEVARNRCRALLV